MANLHKFKLLATHCAAAAAASPTRSPTMSPVFHIRRRRRRTLRMLLSRHDRRQFSLQDGSRDLQNIDDGDADGDGDNLPAENEKEVRVRRKLKDLFVSSPPMEDKVLDKRREETEGLLPISGAGGGIGSSSMIRRSLRPISATFRYRLLRRAWRPVLVSIPE